MSDSFSDSIRELLNNITAIGRGPQDEQSLSVVKGLDQLWRRHCSKKGWEDSFAKIFKKQVQLWSDGNSTANVVSKSKNFPDCSIVIDIVGGNNKRLLTIGFYKEGTFRVDFKIR